MTRSINFYFLDFLQTRKLFDVLEEHGIDARFVGGCVRDAILGLRTDDFDIAVACNVDTLQNVLNQHGITTIPTGIKYGSITAIVDNLKFELTSLRIDEHCSGRWCDIKETYSFEADAARRDFSMNAIYVSRHGEVFDYYNGQCDLQNRNIIFIGDPKKRIQEDYLRIMRYFRFCARFGDLSNRYCKIFKETKDGLNKLSVERIQKELLLIFGYQYKLEILRFMKEIDMFEIDISTYEKLLALEKNPSLEFQLYSLFQTEFIFDYLKLSRQSRKLIRFFERYNLKSYM